MHVEKVIQFDKQDKEADLLVSDGRYSVICYAYPIESVRQNQKVTELYGFNSTSIFKVAEKVCSIKKLSSYYEYTFIAQVISVMEGIVQIGEIRIHLDTEIPKDIFNGEYISFSVVRLDIC